MTTIYLVRHAEAEGNAYRRIHGQYNSLITENGLRQIEALTERFRDIHIDACYASDLYRTCKTAQAVYLAKNLPLHTDKRFREVSLGRWEDVPFGYLERFETESMRQFNQDERHWHIDGSETWQEYTDRFLDGLNDVAQKHDGQTIAIFSHACVLRGVQKRLLDTDDLIYCDNTAVSRVQYENGTFTFDILNDNSHLTPEISTQARQSAWKKGNTRADYSMWYERAPGEAETYYSKLRDETAGSVTLCPADTPEAGGILEMHMAPDKRGRAFGQQLLGQAVSIWRSRGAKRLQTTVPADNDGALRFFKAHGFMELGRDASGVHLEKDIEVHKLP